ncbi:HTH-type transcriptional regulator NorG [Fundidesulfovibrio magnetotacticus]|uniref:HTH-type transcriptional regulator NorG n=1 Tax=Fundidesulfovibrio magnetotacticus TaxID=2730080 RepID=A0A6V8LQW5_9BACT|nr:PLP-dependent aminotransferase family protein [Fundidesulfovibrio magnetotacticus]GFK92951.1 HTH-type transcriptional regulator NorG [Fundidesulfovibrio magnetotacticus]
MQPESYRYETVRQSVLEQIESGGLKPGDKAPSLRRLAQRMRVSLSTVLLAYGQLESEGVLEARPKSGYFVRARQKRLPLPRVKSCPDEFPETLNRARLIGKLLENMARRDLVPLGVARTDEALLPLAQLNRMLAQTLRDEGERTGYYGPVPGLESLRVQIASHCLDAGIECGPSGVVVTNGAMEALHVALRSVTRPGDTVAIASPTYYCFLQLLENLGLRVIEVPSRPGEGVRPADLALITERFRVAACVLTPNFNNPDGALTPDPAKAEIVEILARTGTPLIEDDVYGDLHHGPERPRCCKSYDREGLVLHCSSFSKSLSPGYRVGWLMPGRFLDKALEIKATVSVATATPTQMAVAEFLRQGLMHRHLKRLRPALKSMMDNMLGLIERHFPPGTRATRPSGGTVCWVELPGGGDGVEFMRLAMDAGISAAPGALFSSQGCFRRFVRLSAGVRQGPELEAAVKTLGRIAWELSDAGHETPASEPWENDPIAMPEALLKDS